MIAANRTITADHINPKRHAVTRGTTRLGVIAKDICNGRVLYSATSLNTEDGFVGRYDSVEEAADAIASTWPAEDTTATKAQPARRTRRAKRRTRRATLRQRTAQTRAAAKIHREGAATLTTHCIAAGLGTKEARTVASSLRKNATKASVTGTPGVSYTKGRARQCTRYTPAEVARIAVIYRPRKPAYKAAAAKLALAA